MLAKCFENIRLVGQSLIIILAITGPLAFFTLDALSAAASKSQMLFASKPRCVGMLGESFLCCSQVYF